jgi:hypothetical protein
VPSAPVERHVLRQSTVARDQHVRGDHDVLNRREKGMCRGGQVVAEKPVDPTVAELTGWQADAVHDDETELGADGPIVEVRGHDSTHAQEPPRRLIDDHLGSRNLLQCAAGMRARL